MCVKKAVSFIVDKIGDAACPTWQSIGSAIGGFRVAVKKDGNEWYIGFHKGSGGGRYRSDGWTVTKLVRQGKGGIAKLIDDDVQEVVQQVLAVFA